MYYAAYWRASNVLDVTIAIVIPSVGQSVRQTNDPCLSGSRYRDMIRTKIVVVMVSDFP